MNPSTPSYFQSRGLTPQVSEKFVKGDKFAFGGREEHYIRVHDAHAAPPTQHRGHSWWWLGVVLWTPSVGVGGVDGVAAK